MDSACIHGPRTTRHRFLQSAIDVVAGNTSGDIDFVILPPETGDSVESDEDEVADDDGLDYEYLPSDVPGEVKVQNIEQDESDEDDIHGHVTSEHWRKNKKCYYHPTIPLPISMIKCKNT